MLTDKDKEIETARRLAVNMFVNKMVDSARSRNVIPTEQDLEECRKVIDHGSYLALEAMKEKTRPEIKSFADNMTGLVLVAQVGLGAMTALRRMYEIEQVKKKLALDNCCPVTVNCCLKKDHQGDCIVGG